MNREEADRQAEIKHGHEVARLNTETFRKAGREAQDIWEQSQRDQQRQSKRLKKMQEGKGSGCVVAFLLLGAGAVSLRSLLLFLA